MISEQKQWNESVLPPQSGYGKKYLNFRQGYLKPAKAGGIDAYYAWQFRGGDGKGKVKFVVIEQGWIAKHKAINIRTFPDTGINHHKGWEHGTASMGVVMMKNIETKAIGIASNVEGYVISEWRPDGIPDLADSIRCATQKLDYGDIILIEVQAPDVSPPYKLWPAEVEEVVFQAICAATRKGIIVIEPAGNGSMLYKKGNNLDTFMSIEKEKIFKRSGENFRDSGAIMVAAATSTYPHTKINRSNYGGRINCYAWGEKVTTAGSFPEQSYGNANTYTNKFGGTSSASAIIAGVAISVQSIAEANMNKRLGPKEMRDILGNPLYGTASLNGIEKDRIGIMPDLKKIIDKALKLKIPALYRKINV